MLIQCIVSALWFAGLVLFQRYGLPGRDYLVNNRLVDIEVPYVMCRTNILHSHTIHCTVFTMRRCESVD